MGIAFYIGVCIIAGPLLLLTIPGYWRLFEKAGRRGWEVLIPFYNTYAMLNICGRPSWWLVWAFVPGFNFIALIAIHIDFVKSYGKFKIREQLASILFAFIYILKWGFDGTQYLGPYASRGFQEKHGKQAERPAIIDWGIVVICTLAVLASLRMLIIESYLTTTPAMERTLLEGDSFFVSKLSYGARLPMRPLSIPFVNNYAPGTGIKTYSDGIKLPYMRLPGLGSVGRNDIVVFNYPMEADSPYYRPVDKRTPFIKRCIAVAGDTFSMTNAEIYINGKKIADPVEVQMNYKVELTGAAINPEVFKQLHITGFNGIESTMTAASAKALRGYSGVKSVNASIAWRGQGGEQEAVFPAVYPSKTMLNRTLPDYKWNMDNFGPIVIPAKGWTVKLDSLTFPLYERVIEVYENNTVKTSAGVIFINGKKTDSYTFKMNYYWMMGDNRHDSLDSRFWGFVPEDHIIGEAVAIWTSTDSSEDFGHQIRWDRFFMKIR